MTNQDFPFIEKLLPPYPEHRKEFVIELLEIMEGFNKAIETVEDHFPQQNSFFQKLTRQPPENWKIQTILTVKMTSDILNKTQNSLDRLIKIWPQGIVVTDYYQKF